MTARALALELLQKAERNNQFLNIALDHALSHGELGEADRKLVATLVYGVTEKRLTLDYQIDRLSSRPAKELECSVRTALRLGLYQLIFLDRIPPHAAINETVALVHKKARGLVNAVLRAYTRADGLSLPDRADGVAPYLSIRYSVGLPLTEKLLSVFGEAKTESILASWERIPPTTLAVNTLRVTRDELQAKIPDSLPTTLSRGGLAVKGAVRSLYGFEEGLFFVQDEASQLCVEALGAEAGETVLDICACPGSKSFGSAVRMKNQGRILSFDLHEKKLPLIESGAKRLGITIIEAFANDGRNFLPEWEGAADRVLCDVPCSGFGVPAKKPELRYKDPAASAALPAIQRAILDTACRYVRMGGVLVYSTCTILPEENEENVNRFLASHPEFSLEPFTAGNLRCEAGMLTFLSDEYPTDGFFVARLRRIGKA